MVRVKPCTLEGSAMNEDIGLFHIGAGETEVDAAHRISKSLPSLRTAILNQISEAGDRGIIPDEAWESIVKWRPGTPEPSVRPRFNELWESGLIRRNGSTRKNRREGEEEVWVSGVDPVAINRRKAKRRNKALCIGCLLKGSVKKLKDNVLDLIEKGRSVRCSDCGFTMQLKEEKDK